MRTKKTKLVLGKETLKALSSNALAGAAGGDLTQLLSLFFCPQSGKLTCHTYGCDPTQSGWCTLA